MAVPSPLMGQTLSHCRVVAKLGGDGMGVYKAEGTRFGGSLALNSLPPEVVHDPPALQRFRCEAQAASASKQSTAALLGAKNLGNDET